MAFSFQQDQSLDDFQQMIGKIYGLPDDRLFALWDLLSQLERFSMRALKGIRKKEKDDITLNLLIAFSWLMAIANRLHINLDEEVWMRFPGLCSYCGSASCICKATKPARRKTLKPDNKKRPKSIADMQRMFERIYPARGRTLEDAGIHFAEEVGEVSEAIHNYLGQHQLKQFDSVQLEMADYTSCAFGVANSANIDMTKELTKMFRNNCHVCHKAPCICSFSAISAI